jgi:hypothetical protein
MPNTKTIDPVPEKFNSYEDAAEFWDTHDTSDYPEVFRDVEIEVNLKRRRFEIEIDSDVMPALQKAAKSRGVSISRLASDILKRDLAKVG